jgi:hypothetical protein
MAHWYDELLIEWARIKLRNVRDAKYSPEQIAAAKQKVESGCYTAQDWAVSKADELPF